MEHSTKLQAPCRPAHSRNSIRSAPSPALCCSDNRRQVSFQQHPPQELVKMERPSPAQSHSQSESSWKKKKDGLYCLCARKSGKTAMFTKYQALPFPVSFSLGCRLSSYYVSPGRFSDVWSLVFIRARNTVADLQKPTLKFWDLWESSLCSQTGPAASPVVFPPLFGYLSNGIRKQTPQNWPFLRPALWHSGKFSHTDEGELEPDLALEPPCNCSQSDASDLAVRRLPLSPTVPFVPTHKPMSFKTLGNVGVGVGGGI